LKRLFSEPPAVSRLEHRQEREIITKHITFTKAPESIVSPSEGQSNGLVSDSTTEPVNGAHNASDVPSSEASAPNNLPDDRQGSPIDIPKSENEKHEFVGNPIRDPAYWERSSGKKVAEFHLATHPSKEKTLYYRIRAFDKQAERVRDSVRKGQTEVSVVAYGPKYWPVTRTTKDGQEKKEVVQGYYAGFVNVPRRYREAPPATQQPLA
jgi:hypothetical protein